MDCCNEEIKYIKSNNILMKVKSIYILKNIYDYLSKYFALKIIKYNKKIQKRLDININDYKEYSEHFTPIEIEIIPIKNIYGKFINISKKEEELYYHIYFNDSKEEVKRNILNTKDNNVSIIKVIIDYQVKSFEELFLYQKIPQK